MNAAPAPAGAPAGSPAPAPLDRRRRLRRGRPGSPAALAATLLGVALLAGCGSANDTSSTSAGSAAADGAAVGGSQAGGAEGGGVAAPAADAGAAAGKASNAAGSSGDSAGALTRGVAAAASPRLIRTADVSFEVKDLAAAAARVRGIAPRYGGYVASETTGLNEPTESDTGATGDAARTVARGEATLVLRVLEPKLDAAVGEVAGQVGGKELSRRSSSSDVTGDIADLQSRVATQRASVVRVRALLEKAASIQEVVLLESELTRRESDLEAAEARLAALSDQADLATLTVTLRTPEAVTPEEKQSNGFLTGLDGGWNAVKASTTIVLTLLGALLPVAMVAGLLGWPLWLLRNRRSARRQAPRPAPQPAPDRYPVMAGAPAGPDPDPAGQQPPPAP